MKGKISIHRVLLGIREILSAHSLGPQMMKVCLCFTWAAVLALLGSCGPSSNAPPPERTEALSQGNGLTLSQRDFHGERQALDKGILAGEVLAGSYGQFMEALWDEYNQSKMRVDIFRRLTFGFIRFGDWSHPRNMEHGISVQTMGGNTQRWLRDEWHAWLSHLEQQGFQLEHSQWRHVGFDPDADQGPVSEYQFEINAHTSGPVRRWILRGKLRVDWIPLQTHQSFPEVRGITILEAELVTRAGLPPFDHVQALDVTPSDHDVVLEPNLQVVDLNKDGLPEIILSRINQVLWNRGQGKFRQGKLVEFPLEDFHQGVFADFDGDNQLDFLTAHGGGLALYSGDGRGSFAQSPRMLAHLKFELVNPFVLTAGDIDADGDLDVWLGQYKVPYQGGQMPSPYFDANDGYPSFLLENRGNGDFRDITLGSGLESMRFRRTYSASLVDLDHDLDLDLVIISDFAGVDVYRNDGSGQFESVTDAWIENHHGFGMAHLVGDWNLDGSVDFLMIGMHSATVDRMHSLGIRRIDGIDDFQMRNAMAFGNRLYLGKMGRFEQDPSMRNIERTGWSWGAANIDFDLDGDEDVYIVNGHISGAGTRDYEPEFWREDLYLGNSEDNETLNNYFESKQLKFRQSGASYGGHERNRFFLNQGGEKWLEVAYLFGLAMPQDCRNVVSADLDLNGTLDLVVTTFELWPNERQVLHIFPNFHKSEHHWIGLTPQASRDYPPLMGGKLIIQTPEGSITRPILSGDGYRSQSPYQRVVGLGSGVTVEDVNIIWPNGKMKSFGALSADLHHVLHPE
jgi:hypothetical protein